MPPKELNMLQEREISDASFSFSMDVYLVESGLLDRLVLRDESCQSSKRCLAVNQAVADVPQVLENFDLK
jgi:hypothetical protein